MARAVALVTAGFISGCTAQATSIAFLGDFNVPPGTSFVALDDERLGGVSAVVYDEDSGHWLALSDARTQPRFYELRVDYDGRTLDVRPLGLTRLVDDAGAPFPENVLDPEGLVETPWRTLLVVTEADSQREPVEQAKLLEFDGGGRLLRRWELPSKFLIDGRDSTRGLRHNLGFESLALSVDGRRLFVGTETSLLQDGPEVSFEERAFCRIIEYRVDDRSVTPVAELAYPLGPVGAVEGLGESEPSVGLVELVALGGDRLLALERDFVRERSGARRGVNRSRLFLVDIEGASDVAGVASLATGAGFTPVRKTLLLDFDDIVPRLSPEFPRLDNFEAMGIGPALPDGGRSLLVVSDDNFREEQRTVFLLFSLKAVVE